MSVIDGAQLRAPHSAAFEVVIVGSGPAGATVARALARAGLTVAVVEEGRALNPADAPRDGFTAMADLYRGLGATLTSGPAPMPFVQGRAVGGTSVVNGAICWRLPRDVHEEWLRADPALASALPWESLEREFDILERDLAIAPTPDGTAGRKNLLMARGAEALGLEHRAISRNTRHCRGLGRCLQGCPEGNKLSMDRTFLPEAVSLGLSLFSSVRVRRLLFKSGRCIGVAARAASGVAVQLQASRAVVLAASAVQSPLLLRQSGIRRPALGHHFMGHPGVSLTGRFREPVRNWEGATQGHEVIGLRREGIKFEVLGYDLAILASRRKGVGRALSRDINELAHWLDWGAAIKADAKGRVSRGLLGTRVQYALTGADMQKVRKGVAVMGCMMLAAGAESVSPGVAGWDEQVTDPARMAAFEHSGPLDPRAYAMAVTHMFGTCRMGSDPATSVVGPDFRVHGQRGLYVADSSIFPTNTGVNPQTSIMALAALCAHRIAHDT